MLLNILPLSGLRLLSDGSFTRGDGEVITGDLTQPTGAAARLIFSPSFRECRAACFRHPCRALRQGLLESIGGRPCPARPGRGVISIAVPIVAVQFWGFGAATVAFMDASPRMPRCAVRSQPFQPVPSPGALSPACSLSCLLPAYVLNLWHRLRVHHQRPLQYR